VGALIFQNDRILMVERAGEPLKGWWSLPGGVVETGETLEQAVRREVREETGLEVGELGFVEVFERIMPDEAGNAEYHYVLIDYLCHPVGGTLRAGDDAGRVAWVTEPELANMHITEGTPGVIAKGFRMMRNS
jgi:ADP-ribose pyrophosphatase YjhB (NUDIX family)